MKKYKNKDKKLNAHKDGQWIGVEEGQSSRCHHPFACKHCFGLII